ncbi:hypothetical protein AB6A40_000191 [Gnathostoma spinigerum]|uniref:Uncharacterized protein n=1 Tax=Gnathostoma spinigerum TaxID=75299 RepID=A0ABD6E3P1_9BILA
MYTRVRFSSIFIVRFVFLVAIFNICTIVSAQRSFADTVFDLNPELPSDSVAFVEDSPISVVHREQQNVVRPSENPLIPNTFYNQKTPPTSNDQQISSQSTVAVQSNQTKFDQSASLPSSQHTKRPITSFAASHLGNVRASNSSLPPNSPQVLPNPLQTHRPFLFGQSALLPSTYDTNLFTSPNFGAPNDLSSFLNPQSTGLFGLPTDRIQGLTALSPASIPIPSTPNPLYLPADIPAIPQVARNSVTYPEVNASSVSSPLGIQQAPDITQHSTSGDNTIRLLSNSLPSLQSNKSANFVARITATAVDASKSSDPGVIEQLFPSVSSYNLWFNESADLSGQVTIHF